MATDAACPRCHTPLPANPGEPLPSCPRCAAGAAPWWATWPDPEKPKVAASPPAGEAPWWVPTPAAPPTTSPEKPPLPPMRSSGRTRLRIGLAAGVLLAVGLAVAVWRLATPGDEPAAPPVREVAARPAAREAEPADAPAKAVAVAVAQAPAAQKAERLPPPAVPDAEVPEPPAAPAEVAELAGKAEQPAEPEGLPWQRVDADPADAPASVQAARRLLALADKDARRRGAAVLGHHGNAAKGAAATLAYTMECDPDNATANEAAVALAKIGRAGVPHLIEGLKHVRAAVRQRAAAALARISHSWTCARAPELA